MLPPREASTPDFAILLQGEERWYETTEADRPGRKRGAETFSETIQHIQDDEWVEPEAYLNIIRERTASKARKSYEKCEGLIIWSNAFPIAREHEIDEAWWKLAAEPARAAFPEIWNHFKDRFSRIF